MRRTMGPCLVAVLMTQIAAGQAVALEKYLCVGEKSTGFAFRDESWSVSSFEADKDFYVIEEVDPYVSGDKTIAFAVRRVGRADYQLFCDATSLTVSRPTGSSAAASRRACCSIPRRCVFNVWTDSAL